MMINKYGKKIFLVSIITLMLLANAGSYSRATKSESAIHTIYVAKNGDKNASGDKKHPLNSLQKAMDMATEGTTIYVRKGTYKGPFVFHKSGSKNRGCITVTAYKNEKVIISGSKNKSGAAFNINGCSYINIQRLKISDMKAKDVCGILLEQSENNITIRNCEFEKLVTTEPGSKLKPGGNSNAILLLGEGKKSIHHIYILSNKVHDNVNGWSENISVAGNCKYIYVKKNKIYNNTNIGIDFYGNAEYCPIALLDQPRNCQCIGNIVYNCISPFAENAGIYVDGARDVLVKGNKVFKNHYGIEIGSEEWRNYYSDENRVQNIKVCENIIYDNYESGLRIGGWSNDETTGVVYGCKVIDNDFKRGNYKCEIILAKCENIVFKGNRFKNNKKCRDVVVYDDGINRNKIKSIKMSNRYGGR